MKVANNSISKKLAAHFIEHGAIAKRNNEYEITFNDEFKKESERIKNLIEKNITLVIKKETLSPPLFFNKLYCLTRMTTPGLTVLLSWKTCIKFAQHLVGTSLSFLQAIQIST